MSTPEETRPLLGASPRPQQHRGRELQQSPASEDSAGPWTHLRKPISTARGDVLLLACCFVTGLVDCAAYARYGAFAGIQTGNTILLFLSLTTHPTDQPYATATTLTSLSAFFAGAFLTAHLGRAAGPTRRATMAAQFALQGALVLLAALLTHLHVLPGDRSSAQLDHRVIAALAPLALAAGATMATARLLGFASEIPVNVLTSSYAALACDPGLLSMRNKSRDRRIAAFVCVALGVLGAASAMGAGVGVAVVYWVAGGVKVALAGVVLFVVGDQEGADAEEA